MNQKQLIPFKDCFTVDVTNDIIALHETGHVIVMYALGMIDRLTYVTKKAGSGTLGLLRQPMSTRQFLLNLQTTSSRLPAICTMEKTLQRAYG